MKRQMEDDTVIPNLDINRLGKCEVCNNQSAKYTCPKCEIKSCCIKCLNIHKKELNCDGVRDRTKFIPLKKMTKLDFMNDYYFLEECTRYVDDRKTDKMKRYTKYNKTLPSHLFHLRNAALERKTTLKFLLPNFTRNKSNTTYYDYGQKLILWRVEWIFVNAMNLKCIDEKCNENLKLYELLDKYVNPGSDDEVPMRKHLEVYQSRGIGNLRILLKAEGIQRSSMRFYELDCKKTLRENLAEKIIVEFPIIHVCYDNIAEEHDVIDSDEDVLAEANNYQEAIEKMYNPRYPSKLKTDHQTAPESEQAKAKKRQEQRKRRLQNETEPKNFLFAKNSHVDENPIDCSSSDDTEEET